MESENVKEEMVSNARGEKLFWKSWPIKEKPSKLIFVCHGYGEHCQRYLPMIKFLNENGFYVFSHDHVGHGKSEGDRVYIEDVNYYVDDIHQHITKVKQELPGVPCFIIGHSMGGLLTTLTALKHPDLVDGVITIGPLLCVHPSLGTPIKKSLARLLCWILPRFQLGQLEVDTFTKDQKIRESILNDDLCFKGGCKTRTAVALMDAIQEAQDGCEQFKVPYLLTHGTEDLLCDISGSELFHQKSASKDKKFSKYEGAYHQIHYEPDGVKEAWYKEMLDWLQAR